jgi:hypothetical protein
MFYPVTVAGLNAGYASNQIKGGSCATEAEKQNDCQAGRW